MKFYAVYRIPGKNIIGGFIVDENGDPVYAEAEELLEGKISENTFVQTHPELIRIIEL